MELQISGLKPADVVEEKPVVKVKGETILKLAPAHFMTRSHLS